MENDWTNRELGERTGYRRGGETDQVGEREFAENNSKEGKASCVLLPFLLILLALC